MKSAGHVIRLLKERDPNLLIAEADLWDLLPAARGITVVLRDGRVLPLVLGDNPARQLLHLWSVETREG